VRKRKAEVSDEAFLKVKKFQSYARLRGEETHGSLESFSMLMLDYHAILEHVGSSIREGLWGKGARVAVVNDKAHHVANEPQGKVKKWKEFLADEGYGFHYILGVSGTCYVKKDYFSDVIYRYSLLRAQEERYVKRVEYVAEMPETGDPDEKWQLIRNRHEETKRRLKARRLLPLTIRSLRFGVGAGVTCRANYLDVFWNCNPDVLQQT
jgi:hypothetical protein